VVDRVDLASIDERERVTRHDVKARIEEFSANGFANTDVKGDNTANTLDFSGVVLTDIARVLGQGGNDLITVSRNFTGNTLYDGGTGQDTLQIKLTLVKTCSSNSGSRSAPSSTKSLSLVNTRSMWGRKSACRSRARAAIKSTRGSKERAASSRMRDRMISSICVW